MLRALLADDEPLALRRLRSLLADHADVEVVAETDDAESTLAALRSAKPDVAFVDIQLPGFTGLDVVERLRVTPKPIVVFVTAHADHAVRAFEAGAIDYLLKPFDERRLAASLDRVRAVFAARRALANPASIAHVVFLDRVAITLGRRTRFVRLIDVDWIEANGNYVRLVSGDDVHLLRSALGALEEQLDPRVFVRIHRSYVVRLDFVRELRSAGQGDYRAVLANGKQLPVSQRYRSRLP